MISLLCFVNICIAFSLVCNHVNKRILHSLAFH